MLTYMVNVKVTSTEDPRIEQRNSPLRQYACTEISLKLNQFCSGEFIAHDAAAVCIFVFIVVIMSAAFLSNILMKNGSLITSTWQRTQLKKPPLVPQLAVLVFVPFSQHEFQCFCHYYLLLQLHVQLQIYVNRLIVGSEV